MVIIEITVTGVLHSENGSPYWKEELITRKQTLIALTINVAKQMFIEDERGSISAGKYTDFLLMNKDVLTCPVTEIHNAKTVATYFEGKKSFLNVRFEKLDIMVNLTRRDFIKSAAVGFLAVNTLDFLPYEKSFCGYATG